MTDKRMEEMLAEALSMIAELAFGTVHMIGSDTTVDICRRVGEMRKELDRTASDTTRLAGAWRGAAGGRDG